MPSNSPKEVSTFPFSLAEGPERHTLEGLNRYPSPPKDSWGNATIDMGPGIKARSNSAALTQAKYFLQRDGFTHIPNFLSDRTVGKYKKILAQLWDQEGTAAGKDHVYSDDARRLANLIEKHKAFQFLAINPTILELCQHVIGDNFGLKLGMFNARSVPHSPLGQTWHSDGNFKRNIPLAQPSDATAIIYLSDTAPSEAPTIVIPGSHLFHYAPDSEVLGTQFIPEELLIVPKTGDLIVLNGYLWHRGGKNESSIERPRLLQHYKSDRYPVTSSVGIQKNPARDFSMNPLAEELIHYR